MARLLFDGHAHSLTLLDDGGTRVNRRYVIQDRLAPFAHRAQAASKRLARAR